MNIKGFEVPDELYKQKIAQGLSPAVCFGCGDQLGFVRDIRQDNYCPACAPKASILKKYSRPGYNPTAAERARIFSNTHRPGRS